MTELLCRFINNREDTSDPRVRASYGSMASIVGIVLNLFIAASKFAAGVISGSVAITADATNNLSDAGSSIISLISFKISTKPADRDHPFGHARIEYIAAMIVSFLILIIGLTLGRESVEKIINPVPMVIEPIMYIILTCSILLKIWLSLFNRKLGKRIDSNVMMATSVDSLSDAVATSAVLISVIICALTGVNTDGYMGVLVAGFIIYSGFKILRENLNSILGEAPDPELVEDIKDIVNSHPEALGIHDMAIHNYGPGKTVASLHVEVDGAKDIFESHDVIDNIEAELRRNLGIMATIHLDPIVTDNEKINAVRGEVLKKVKEIDERLDIHDFRFVEGTTHTNLIFDIVVPFEVKTRDEEITALVKDGIKEIDPKFLGVINVDRE